jgi:hypothetical protein
MATPPLQPYPRLGTGVIHTATLSVCAELPDCPFLELCGQGPQAALQRQAHAAIGSLLQLIREGSDEQVTT